MILRRSDFKAAKGFVIGVIFTLIITVGITGVVFAANGTFKGMNIVNIVVNNKTVISDVPAVIMNGRTMVPLKFVSEALGATVTWDATTGTVNVNTAIQTATQSIPAPIVIPETSVPVPTPIVPEISVSSNKSVETARGFLNWGFSRDELIKHLRVMNFTTEDATYAADNSGFDWNEEAIIKARVYVILFSYSRDALIHQLEIANLFTHEQATFAADNYKINWNQ